MKKRKKKLLYFITIPIAMIVILLYFMTAFEYTAVAEIRESFTSVDKQETLTYGKVLFETRGCSGCHATKSHQKSLGPNLYGLANRKSKDYIRESIVTPDAIIVEGFTDVVMPNFGEILDKTQINALVEYVLTIK